MLLKPAPLAFQALGVDAPWKGSVTDGRTRRPPVSPAPMTTALAPDQAIHEIAVPLDGSPYAEHALPWAIQLAEAKGARIRLVHVHSQLGPAVHTRRKELNEAFDRLLRRPKVSYLAAVARRIERTSDATVTPTLAESAAVADTLAKLVVAPGVLVVMASRGRTALGRAVMSNTMDTLLERVEGPLLHVRGYACPVDLTARPPLRHALIPIDDPAHSDTVLSSVAVLNKVIPRRQTLLQVVRSAGYVSCGLAAAAGCAAELRASRAAALDGVAKRWRGELTEVRTSVVWTDRALADEILTQADEQDADFIAVAAGRRGRWSRTLRPGVVDRLIRRSHKPLLIAKQSADSRKR
jgi:nucleotide-binding universal stress UspA family protein